MKKRFASLAALFLVLSLASTGLAQSKRMKAKRLFDRGVLALEEQDYQAALDSFIAAYQISPHWMVLAHIGSCHAKLGDPVQAIAALEKFLEEGGGDIVPGERQAARKLLSEQREKVGILYLVVEPDGSYAKIDGDSIGRSPFARIFLREGSHRVAATVNGNAIEREIRIYAEQELTLRIPEKGELDRASNAPGSVDGAPMMNAEAKSGSLGISDGDEPDGGYGSVSNSETALQKTDSKRGPSVPFYVAVSITGAGILAAGIGGGLYWHYSESEKNWADKLSDSEWSDFSWEDTCHSGELLTVQDSAEQYFCENESTRRNYKTLAGKALVPLIAGGAVVVVAGIASLVFYFNAEWFDKSEEEPKMALTPVFRDNYSGLVFSGRF